MAQRLRVLLLLETSREYGRGLLQGIATYAQLHGQWSFDVRSGDAARGLTTGELKECSGIIGRVRDRRTADLISRCKAPLIALDVSRDWPGGDRSFTAPATMIARILADRDEGVRMVLEHFASRGFCHVAFCGYQDALWSRQRQESFCTWVCHTGLDLHTYLPPLLKRQRTWPGEQPFLARWLMSLPKPVGVMACNDDRGREIIDVCRGTGLKVPYDVAVVGVDNDELICDLTSPALSSVALNTRHAGYEAAALLDKAMAGGKVETTIVPVNALRVMTRMSSDVLAIQDSEVVQAMHFITKHANRTLDVDEVVAAACISRRVLEQRFRRVLGHSILQEIRRVRVERVARLLLESNLTVSQIALELGYSSIAQLIRQFRREKQVPPQFFRQQYGRFSHPLEQAQSQATLLSSSGVPQG